MLRQLKANINAKLDKWFPTAAPQPALRQTRRPPRRPQRETITYEQWKNGKLGKGEKVTAPRGKGQEWADRFYCEQTIEHARYWQGCNKTSKQYRAGSYNDRRRRTAYNDRRLAWDIAMAPAKAIIEPPIPDWADAAAWWKVRREVVKDCREYATCLLDMVR